MTDSSRPSGRYDYYGDLSHGVRAFRHFQATEVRAFEGSGVDGDPFREVSYYFTDTGTLIARVDEWAEAQDHQPVAP